MSDTYEALLLAVLANPEDDSPRLILADWLDENGQPDRAEFIRVQCELARREADGSDRAECSWGGTCACRSHVLRRRERKLWGSYPDENDVRSQVHAEMPPGVEWCLLPESLDAHRSLPFASVRRGFVHSVHCHLADWLAHGAAIVRRQPITKLQLAGLAPAHSNANDHRGLIWMWPAEMAREAGLSPYVLYGTLENAIKVINEGYLTRARRRAFPCKACETTGRQMTDNRPTGYVEDDSGYWAISRPCPACGGRGWKIGG